METGDGIASATDPFFADSDISLEQWGYTATHQVAHKKIWDQRGGSVGNGVYLKTAYSYDSLGNRTEITTPANATYTIAYETVHASFPESVTAPRTEQDVVLKRSFGYDPRFGSVSVLIDENQNGFVRCFDAFGRVVSVQGPPGKDSATTSSCASDLVAGANADAAQLVELGTIEYGLGVSDRFAMRFSVITEWPGILNANRTPIVLYFDDLGRIQSGGGQNPNESFLNEFEFVADSRGLISEMTAPRFEGDEKRTAHMSYDTLGRLTESRIPIGVGADQLATTTYRYESTPAGLTETRTQAPGTAYTFLQKSEYRYRANRLKLESVSQGDPVKTTSFNYDSAGRLTAAFGPAGMDGSQPAFTQQFDSVGRIRASSSPGRGDVSRGYNTEGLLERVTTNQGVFRLEYDLLSRITRQVAPDGREARLAYDDASAENGLGRLTGASSTDSAGTVETQTGYQYDAYGQVAQTTLAFPQYELSYTTDILYDPVGRETYRQNPDGSVINTHYAGSRLTSVGYDGGPGAEFSNYAANGIPGIISYGNGLINELTTTVNGSIEELRVKDGDTDRLARIYERNDLGLLTRIVDPLAADAQEAPLRSIEQKDQRVTNVQDRSGMKWSYEYDDAGNLVQKDDSMYTYQGTQARSADGSDGFVADYDLFGNMTGLKWRQGDSWSFTYDTTGNMLTAEKAADQKKATYIYDHTGRRVIADRPGLGKTIYVSDSYRDRLDQTAADPLQILPGQGYTPLAQSTAKKGSNYLHVDHQSSVIMTSNERGETSPVIEYDPFGELLNEKPEESDFLYTGQELDEFAGFYWYNFRAYHPRVARFMKADDQAGAALTRLDALNDYAYVLNNPTSYSDPTGHACGTGQGVGSFFAVVAILAFAIGGDNVIGIIIGVIAAALAVTSCGFYSDRSGNTTWFGMRPGRRPAPGINLQGINIQGGRANLQRQRPEQGIPFGNIPIYQVELNPFPQQQQGKKKIKRPPKAKLALYDSYCKGSQLDKCKDRKDDEDPGGGNFRGLGMNFKSNPFTQTQFAFTDMPVSVWEKDFETPYLKNAKGYFPMPSIGHLVQPSAISHKTKPAATVTGGLLETIIITVAILALAVATDGAGAAAGGDTAVGGTASGGGLESSVMSKASTRASSFSDL